MVYAKHIPSHRSMTGRYALCTLGWLLIVLAPLIGPLPGPGGVILFAAGLGLLLKNSAWAKRAYVRFKRHHPKWGNWSDWGMRRTSAKRRAAQPSAHPLDRSRG